MPISPTGALALIEPGDPMDITQVHAEIAWIESRALDAGNASGDTMAGPLSTPGLVLKGAGVNPNSFFYFGSDNSVIPNVLTVTASFPNALSTGIVLAVKVKNSNTSAATLNVNSLGANSILQEGIILSGGELPAGAWVLLEFDGTYWNIMGPPPGGNPNQTMQGAPSTGGTSQFVPRSQADSLYGPIPSGTQMVFFQATAPPGWTQNVLVNDQVLHVVNGQGGGAGGTWDNSAGLSVGSHSHYFDHQHDVPIGTYNPIGQNASLAQKGAPPWGAGQVFNAFYTNEYNSSGIASSPSMRSSPITANDSGVGGPNTGNTQPGISSNSSWRPAYINVIVAAKN